MDCLPVEFFVPHLRWHRFIKVASPQLSVTQTILSIFLAYMMSSPESFGAFACGTAVSDWPRAAESGRKSLLLCRRQYAATRFAGTHDLHARGSWHKSCCSGAERICLAVRLSLQSNSGIDAKRATSVVSLGRVTRGRLVPQEIARALLDVPRLLAHRNISTARSPSIIIWSCPLQLGSVTLLFGH